MQMLSNKALSQAAVLSALMLLPAGQGLAQTQDDTAPEVIVSANRIPVEIDKVGTSVSVITSEEIEERQYKTVSDAVRALPGVTVNRNGGLGGTTSVRIRGNSSAQTLVIIDGVVVNDASSTGGEFNFANLRVEDIERIEVLRGPQSTLYGSNSMGGVVNIVTKKGEGAPTVTASLEGGSFETAGGSAGISGAESGVDYRLTVSGLHSDGISHADEKNGNSEEDSYDNVSVSTKLGGSLLDNLKLEGIARYSTSRAEFDTFDPFTFAFQDGDEVSDSEEVTLGGSATLSLFDGRLDNRFSLTYNESKRENVTVVSVLPAPFVSLDSTGDAKTYEYQGTAYVTDTETLVFGAEREKSSIDQFSAYYDAYIAMDLVPNSIDADTANNSFYAMLQTEAIENLTLTGGVRFDDHDDFGNATSWRFTGAYRLPETGTVFRASWAEGFKAPSIYQLNYICFECGLTEAASDLEAEESTAWDVGVEQSFLEERLTLQAIYFEQRTTNLITFDFGQGYTNVGRAKSRGVELVGDLQATDWLTFDGNYSFIISDDETNDTRLLALPKHTAAINATIYPSEPSYLSVGVTYNSSEKAFGGAVVDEWVRVDLRGGYWLSDDVEVFGRVENLFDENYQEVSGYGTPGISGYLGVRATW